MGAYQTEASLRGLDGLEWKRFILKEYVPDWGILLVCGLCCQTLVADQR